jgi:hypothetical protein
MSSELVTVRRLHAMIVFGGMDGKGPIEASFESARSAGWSFPAASRSIWQVIVIVIVAAFIGPFIAGALGYANSNGGIPWIFCSSSRSSVYEGSPQ